MTGAVLLCLLGLRYRNRVQPVRWPSELTVSDTNDDRCQAIVDLGRVHDNCLTRARQLPDLSDTNTIVSDGNLIVQVHSKSRVRVPFHPNTLREKACSA